MDSLSPKNNKAKGGRKPKPILEKVIYKVGGFWLTKAEKDTYDKNFKASGLENHTEFFRRIMFKEPIRMYYQDIHTEKIYAELLKIERVIEEITQNYYQVSKHILTHSSEENLHFLLIRLNELTQIMNDSFQSMLPLFKSFEPNIQVSHSTLSEETPSDKKS